MQKSFFRRTDQLHLETQAVINKDTQSCTCRSIHQYDRMQITSSQSPACKHAIRSRRRLPARTLFPSRPASIARFFSVTHCWLLGRPSILPSPRFVGGENVALCHHGNHAFDAIMARYRYWAPNHTRARTGQCLEPGTQTSKTLGNRREEMRGKKEQNDAEDEEKRTKDAGK